MRGRSDARTWAAALLSAERKQEAVEEGTRRRGLEDILCTYSGRRTTSGLTPSPPHPAPGSATGAGPAAGLGGRGIRGGGERHGGKHVLWVLAEHLPPSPQRIPSGASCAGSTGSHTSPASSPWRQEGLAGVFRESLTLSAITNQSLQRIGGPSVHPSNYPYKGSIPL